MITTTSRRAALDNEAEARVLAVHRLQELLKGFWNRRCSRRSSRSSLAGMNSNHVAFNQRHPGRGGDVGFYEQRKVFDNFPTRSLSLNEVLLPSFRRNEDDSELVLGISGTLLNFVFTLSWYTLYRGGKE